MLQIGDNWGEKRFILEKGKKNLFIKSFINGDNCIWVIIHLVSEVSEDQTEGA